MPEKEISYKSQDVDYLGFIEAQLRDLKGIDTLVYELIQNADDAKDGDGLARSSWISFDVTPDALVVENDGIFRQMDFERLQKVASGSKRDEHGTTGAFGIGFLAVYQITDAPEIFSAGHHWIIRPDAPSSKRIEERRVETTGTRFRLPWATDHRSAIRRILRTEAIAPGQPAEFVTQISEAMELAILFLKQLHTLELKHNGVVVKVLKRSVDDRGHLRIRDGQGQTNSWLVLESEFEGEAESLRQRYRWQIEGKRSGKVRLALPVGRLQHRGRLFAALPTADSLPLPFHIDADFFPTSDRKRIDFGSGFQALWNDTAIQGAAQYLAQNLILLRHELGHTGLWHLLWQVAEVGQLAQKSDLPPVFNSFWSQMSRSLQGKRLLYSTRAEWKSAGELRLPRKALSEPVQTLLDGLDISHLHPELLPYSELMRRPEVGARSLSVEDIVQSLRDLGLARATPLHNIHPPLHRLQAWQALWDLVDDLLDDLPTAAARKEAITRLRPCALLLTGMMDLERPGFVYRGGLEARALFPEVHWIHDAVPTDAFPAELVEKFGVRQATTLLAETPIDLLEEAWRLGRLDLPRLFYWFEAHQIEILADDPSLRATILRLPLCPLQGELRSLAELFIPGGFDDPLKLTGLVDLEAIGGRSQFLQDLGVAELDFDTYLRAQLPKVFAENPALPSDARHQLVELLAARMGEFRDDVELRESLQRLPLIACMDGAFRPPTGIFRTREVIPLLGEHVHIAEPAVTGAVKVLQTWLGVKSEASFADIVDALSKTSSQRDLNDGRLPDVLLKRVNRCWDELGARLARGKGDRALLAALADEPVIPDDQGRVRAPRSLFFAEDAIWLDRIPQIGAYLLSPDSDAAPAMAAAGVRPITEAVQVVVAQPLESKPDAIVQERIFSRIPLIERLLLAEKEAADRSGILGLRDRIQVMRTEELRIEYQLMIGESTLRGTSEAVSAYLDLREGLLIVAYSDDQIPWGAIARQLASAIGPGGTGAGFALGVREVLLAGRAADAEQTLDELGYPEQPGG